MISVIVPVYKVEPYLRQCMDSILRQTYRDLEVLLIDDGSPDRCGDICDEYADKDERVRVFHTENRGLSAARNLGVSKATGEYIGFVDSDDWIEPDMYEVLLERMQETGADIVTCEYCSGATEVPESFVLVGTEGLASLIRGSISNHVWNKLYLRRLFEIISFPEGRNYEDIAIMHLLLEQSQIVARITALKYHYRRRTDSITRSYTAKNLVDYTDAYLSRYNYFHDYYEDIYSENKEEILFSVSTAIFRLWRWWYGCDRREKREYEDKIKELVDFSRRNIPAFGYSGWSGWMRILSSFAHSNAYLSFAILFLINKLIRSVRNNHRMV